MQTACSSMSSDIHDIREIHGTESMGTGGGRSSRRRKSSQLPLRGSFNSGSNTNGGGVESGIVLPPNNTNKKFETLPEHLQLNGVTPSGKPRLFVCKVCTRAFARQEHLTRHERSHTKEKPYVCGICERRFTRRDLLIRHCQKLHGGNCGEYIRRTSRKVRKEAKNAGQAQGQGQTETEALVRTSSEGKRVRKRSTRADSSASSAAMTRSLKTAVAAESRVAAASGSGSGSGSANTDTVADIKPGTGECSPGTTEEKNPNRLFSDTSAHLPKKNTVSNMHRRVSFSAQSGGNYAILPDSDAFAKEKPERVDFSTPQMLPLDFLDPMSQLEEPTGFNLLDRNNWINDFNNDILLGTDDQQGSSSNPRSNSYSESSPASNSNSNSNTRNSSWEIQGDTLKINSLFSFPMSQSDSNRSNTDWKTLAATLKPEIEGVSAMDSTESGAPRNSADEITNTLHNFQLKLDENGTNGGVDFDMNLNQINANGTENGTSKNPISPDFNMVVLGSSVNPNAIHRNGISTHNGIPTESPPLRTNSNIDNELKLLHPADFTPSIDILDHDSTIKGSVAFNPNDNLFNETRNKRDDSNYNLKANTNNSTNNNDNNNDININNNNNNSNDNNNDDTNLKKSKMSLPSSNVSKERQILYPNEDSEDKSHIDPIQLQAVLDPGYTFYDIQYPQPCNISKASPKERDAEIHFFNDEMRRYCEDALLHYSSICGPDHKPCTLSCSNDELNTYLRLYIKRFHPHHPFIHPSIWTQDHQVYRSYVYEQNASNISSSVDNLIHYTNIICLPLFAATIGSLFKNTSSRSASKTKELYEIARRILHVYLDRRKNLKQTDMNTPLNSNLWLIQSLTLSVMYSIFAEHDSSNVNKSDQILKQIGAVCSLLRNYFLPILRKKPPHLSSEAEIIIWESKLRTTLTNYNLCQFLQVFHRVSSSNFIKNQELQTIMIPNDEARWVSLSFNWEDTTINSDHLYHLSFLQFFQSFQFSDLGYQTIPEVLVNAMLFFEYSTKLSGNNMTVFINKIDTKKLEKNLPQIEQNAIASDCLIGDAINLKNSLICLRLFDKLDPHFFKVISKYGLTDHIFENCLSPIHANILSKNSDSLIIDLLVSVNVSIKNIASLFYFTNESGYYQEIKFNYSKTSMYQVQGYFYNFLCILKFILDFEATPNFKVLSIFAELRKIIEQLMIPKLINNYPTEFAKFPDIMSIFEGPSPQNAAPNHTFNLEHLEKLIESVLAQSFNDYNYLKMPVGSVNALNEFDFHSSSEISAPKPSKSSINLMRHHETCKQNGARVKQGFYERYHLSDKLLQVAKCSFLLIYESHVHCSQLSNFIDILNTIQSKFDDQRKMTNILTNSVNQAYGHGTVPQGQMSSYSLANMLNLPNSNTPPGDYYFNPNSL